MPVSSNVNRRNSPQLGADDNRPAQSGKGKAAFYRGNTASCGRSARCRVRTVSYTIGIPVLSQILSRKLFEKCFDSYRADGISQSIGVRNRCQMDNPNNSFPSALVNWTVLPFSTSAEGFSFFMKPTEISAILRDLAEILHDENRESVLAAVDIVEKCDALEMQIEFFTRKRDALKAKNARLLEAISAFCEGQKWADESWKRQPHIKALFDLSNTAITDPDKTSTSK